jgi:hypothetical protein
MEEFAATDTENYSPSLYSQRLLNRLNLQVDRSIFTRVSKDLEFEFWTAQGKLLGSSNGFYALSSFTLEELFRKERSQLFQRDQKYTDQLISGIGLALQGTIVENPVEVHTVTEIKINPVSVSVDIKLITPLYNESGLIVGVAAFLKLKKI